MIRWIDDICEEWGVWFVRRTQNTICGDLPSVMGKLIETAREQVMRGHNRIGRDPIPCRETRVVRGRGPQFFFSMSEGARTIERIRMALPKELRVVLVVQYCYVGVDYKTRTAMVAELSGVRFSPATYYRRIDALHEFIAARICSAELQATNL